MESLTHVGMERHKDTALGHLSGGQQQRVFIARALPNSLKSSCSTNRLQD